MLDFFRKYNSLFALLVLSLYLGTNTPIMVQQGLHTLSHLVSQDYHHWSEHKDVLSSIDHDHLFIIDSIDNSLDKSEVPSNFTIKKLNSPKSSQLLETLEYKKINTLTSLGDLNTFYWSYKSPFLSKTTPPPE